MLLPRNQHTPDLTNRHLKKLLQFAVPGMILLPLSFLGAAAVVMQQEDGTAVSPLLRILSSIAGVCGAMLLFVAYPVSLFRMCYAPSGPKSAVEGRCAMTYAAQQVLRRHRSSSRRSALRICALLLGLQLAAFAVCYVGWARHETFPKRVAVAVVGLLFPFGWTIPIVATFASFEARRFRRDCAAGELRTIRGVIEKHFPSTNDSDELYPDQYIRFQGETGFLRVPLALWEHLPPVSEGVCEYFPNTRIAYRINGANVWDAEGSNGANPENGFR